MFVLLPGTSHTLLLIDCYLSTLNGQPVCYTHQCHSVSLNASESIYGDHLICMCVSKHRVIIIQSLCVQSWHCIRLKPSMATLREGELNPFIHVYIRNIIYYIISAGLMLISKLHTVRRSQCESNKFDEHVPTAHLPIYIEVIRSCLWRPLQNILHSETWCKSLDPLFQEGRGSIGINFVHICSVPVIVCIGGIHRDIVGYETRQNNNRDQHICWGMPWQ